MRCYLDSSALLKRAIREAETADLRMFLEQLDGLGADFLTSALSQVEVARALRRAAELGRITDERSSESYGTIMHGISFLEASPEIITEAQLIGGNLLRSLDAIHLATARVAGADLVVTYDERLLQACHAAGAMTAQPGAADPVLPRGWQWVS